MRTTPSLSVVFSAALLVLTASAMDERASAQQPQQRGQRAPAPTEKANPEAIKRVRVPTSHANVHMGPGSGQQVLVLVSKGTELNVLGRKGEWLQVELTPEMRKTGMVMRWYKNETSGWMHDSTVEPVDAKKPS
jgi:uncharacterized protein YgiM (DUF1202 family)